MPTTQGRRGPEGHNMPRLPGEGWVIVLGSVSKELSQINLWTLQANNGSMKIRQFL